MRDGNFEHLHLRYGLRRRCVTAWDGMVLHWTKASGTGHWICCLGWVLRVLYVGTNHGSAYRSLLISRHPTNVQCDLHDCFPVPHTDTVPTMPLPKTSNRPFLIVSASSMLASPSPRALLIKASWIALASKYFLPAKPLVPTSATS
jgi:hypothetical protein